ncbi:MAG: NB-ARC domain-containing protein [Anaerolineales bacterium]|jgi:hypothetical protein
MDQPTAQTIIQDSVSDNQQSNVHNQVTVGEKRIQIGSRHGSLVHFSHAGEKPCLQRKASPSRILPQNFTGLLGRRSEVERALAALSTAHSVEFYGPGGVGKTSLLRHLTHHPLAQNFPDGLLYLNAGNQLPGDLLQSIFEAFFEYSAAYKPNLAEIRRALQEIRALVVLDNVKLERQYLESLLDCAPKSSFLLVTEERLLWGACEALPLQGLPEKQALELLTRALERPLEAAEISSAKKVCHRLGGYPLYLLQAATLVRDQNRTLVELASLVDKRALDTVLAEACLEATSPAERRVLAVIGTLGGAPLHERHLSQLALLPNVQPLLDRLLQCGLILVDNHEYTLASGIQALFEARGVLERWRVWAMDYFRSWVAERPHQSQEIISQAGGLIYLVEWALDAGESRRALRLARAMEGALIAGCRWDAWNRVLYSALEASLALDDMPAKAWALHQLGTRALCLGEDGVARRHLILAYLLRQALGDWNGSAVTRHNLDTLTPPEANLVEEQTAPLPSERKKSVSGSLKSILIMTLLVALGTTGLIAAALKPSILMGKSNFFDIHTYTQNQIVPIQLNFGQKLGQRQDASFKLITPVLDKMAPSPTSKPFITPTSPEFGRQDLTHSGSALNPALEKENSTSRSKR